MLLSDLKIVSTDRPHGGTLLLFSRREEHVDERTAVVGWWLRAALWDSRTDIADKVALTDQLAQMNALPEQAWQEIPVDILAADQIAELCASLRDIAGRNDHLAEALRTWQTLHGRAFDER
jgi:hypothetical protein